MAALVGLGCGGLLAVNAGSSDEPCMIKLGYAPEGQSTGHLALVGKGIMYDSGGISLKPSDPMHLLMKMDMGGAAAVLGAFTALREAGVRSRVTGYLMCTENMPSGSAYKLGDVLTVRGGTTVGVKNTDAEGRLVMSDGLVLAAEEHPTAIVDIATLTGAALFLAEFVGTVPWAHLDIAGTMQADTDDAWRPRGATGFGARLLLELARGFTTPSPA